MWSGDYFGHFKQNENFLTAFHINAEYQIYVFCCFGGETCRQMGGQKLLQYMN
jgi:hypothetical protein